MVYIYDKFKCTKISTMKEVKELFPKGKADWDSWCFLGTGGNIGIPVMLNDIEANWDVTDDNDENYCGHSVTVMIIRVFNVSMYYGDIPITKEDIPYLKALSKDTVFQVEISQDENH